MRKSLSNLRRIWDLLFLDIDRQLSNPDALSDSMRARILACQAREDFTKATLYPHKVLTAQNRIITPYRMTITERGGIRVNMEEFVSQPRLHELRAQMAPAEKSGKIMLDEQSGKFYHSETPHAPLGQIDIKTETALFSHAAQATRVKLLFGDASAANPICVDMGTGAVYAQKSPENIRGHLRLGQEIIPKRCLP